MKLSIITCTYNSEKYLPQCIEAIESQELQIWDKIEHIIIDWKSNDKTIPLLQWYKNRVNYPVKIIETPPMGIYNAYNRWIEFSSWEFILFYNSDDFLEKGCLKKVLKILYENKNIDLFYGGINIVDENWFLIRKLPKFKYFMEWLNSFFIKFSCYITCPAVFYKRDLHSKFGFFDESLKIVADYKFWIELSRKRIKTTYMPITISNFRSHKDSVSESARFKKRRIKELIGVFREQYWIFWYIYVIGYLIHTSLIERFF